MNELINTNPDVNVRETEYKRLLGYPDSHELIERSKELADWARQWYNENGQPWVYAIKCDNVDLSAGKIKIGGTELFSEKFYTQLREAEVSSVMLAAVSAGHECEQKAVELWNEGKPDEYFFLEVYGSAVAEHLTTQIGFKFCEWADENTLAVLPHYSPGYPGWDILDQENLLTLIQQRSKGKLPGEIKVLDSGMLYPKKSLLAVFGITKNVEAVRRLSDLIPCETCTMFSCRYRRVPFKYSRSKFEDVKKLQPGLKT